MTKSMAEDLLKKNRKGVPLVIFRPSIIGSSWEEPFPGWVDTLSAAGIVLFLMELALLHYLHGSIKNIGDVVAVD